MNVRVVDNGWGFMVTVNGMIVEGFRSLGAAWNHIAWMHRVACQEFTVGENEVPVKEWIDAGIKNGYLDTHAGYQKS